ncbi:MAG: hypothetical protein ACK6D6_14380 [Planctomyces sp.]|jgi:hypothetical protein
MKEDEAMRTRCRTWGFLIIACLSVLSVLGGRTAVAAERTLTIRDTIGRDWAEEPITWSVEFTPGEWSGTSTGEGKAVVPSVTRDGKPIPAQAQVLERHADGSVKSAAVRLVVDQLAKDAATEIKLDTAKSGPADTQLRVERGAGFQALVNQHTGVKLSAGGKAEGPILGIRLASGKWAGSSAYTTTTAKATGSKFELLQEGPVYLEARVTTTFDNGRTHALTVGLWAGSRVINLDETFDLGPDETYKFKEYKEDRDELAWEWWSWFGDKDGTQETHPNNWVLTVSGNGFTPDRARHGGEHGSTDPVKKDQPDGYALTYARPQYLQKYLVGRSQWRPDGVAWYLAAAGKEAGSDAIGLCARTVRNWRNPNVHPLPQGVTLRTGANDLRILSLADGKTLAVSCPIGLGRRSWAIRPSTWGESLQPQGTSATALNAEVVRQNMGLDITRSWITDWQMDNRYPRLFIKPEQKAAYYARLKGKGIGSPGNPLDTFLRNQDQAGFQMDYDLINKQADSMISGYCAEGLDGTYPGWMLGYWHGMIVAGGIDNLLGSEFCTEEQSRLLKKKLAILTYCLVSKDAWPDKQINYGWGSMNMPVARWGGLVVMASAISDHPMAKDWLKDAGRCFDMLLRIEYSADGVGVSCPHYIGTSATSLYAWFALANSGLAEDRSTSEILQRHARYYMQLMTPADPRWGIRTLICEGDSRPGSSSFPGILGTLFRGSNPELSAQLMQMWKEGGSDLTGGMGVPDLLIIDPALPTQPLALHSEVYPGFGAFLRHRLNTPGESYLAFCGGDFMFDHQNTDAMAFHWHELGVPLSVFTGSMYQPMTCTAISHNTICWDLRPGGAKDPGKDQPGNWYHDKKQPWADLGGKTPTLHWEVGFDKASMKNPVETRGQTTFAAEAPEASLIEGRVEVKALTETPTRPENGEIAIANNTYPPGERLEKPFTWTRRLLSVRAPGIEGMNYLVIRDDFGGYADRTPFFQYWSLSEDAALAGQIARFKGQLGVDTDLVVLQPMGAELSKDSFTHNQCEPNVSHIHQQKYGKGFEEKQVVCRAKGKKGEGFLAVIFPRKAGEPEPVIESWAGGAGAKIAWKGETHYVLLDTKEREVNADGIKAKAGALVCKTAGGKATSLTLLAGGTAEAAGAKTVTAQPLPGLK